MPIPANTNNSDSAITSLAIISDIHSNSLALAAVLKDIASRRIPLIVNLGDALLGPIDPLGTARMLMAQPHLVNIMGNCDQILLESESQSASYQFVKPLLTSDIEQWISTFQSSWAWEQLFFCHGTPFANNRYLMEEVTASGVILKDPAQLALELQDIAYPYLFCGHSHVYKRIYLPDGKLIVNAGSVGLPAYEDEEPLPHVMESHTPHAEYVIARKHINGWSTEHISLPYDWEQASAIARSNGREDYAYALRTGHALSLSN